MEFKYLITLNGLKMIEENLNMKFMSKGYLAKKLNVSSETLRLKMKEIKGLDTSRRKLLYPWEVKLIYLHFGYGK